ncbi:MAG: SDR family oxidoreductase [Spirochaetia bacterium]|jgi:3-oxoacyl-[acyl-carrier protein] reductase
MNADLSGRVALVTGAGRGIGRAISLSLADAGARMFLTARSADQLEDTAREIRARGREVEILPADVSREKDVASVFETLQKRFGRLDVLVNNAGQGFVGPLAELPVSALDTMMAVNVRGVFLFCQKAMQMMIPARSGYIVNIASVAGVKAYVLQSAYAASKHAVMGITKGLAAEAQPHGIRVSVVLPGAVDTTLMDALRPDLDKAALMRPQDVADAVLFLLSLSETAAVDEIYIRRRSSAPF